MTDKKAKPKAIKTLDDLSFDQRNANKGTALGQTMVEQSIERYGAGRSIVADKDGVVIGGNKTLQAAREQGLDVQVIRTKGEALIVHQREDLSLDEDGDARMLAYIDNRSSEVGLDWDADILQVDIDDGLDLGDIFSDADLDIIFDDIAADSLSDNYTRKIVAPIYEPKGDEPELSELYKTSKTDELNKRIDDAEIPDDIKQFLHIAAARHTVLDFHNIAEYYAHAPAVIQDLMEQSALVIIDFDKAIECGFVEMTKALCNLVGDEYGDE